MHWDDLQLLQLIDHLEQQENGANLQNGHYLLERFAKELAHTIDWERDVRPFAYELLLAHQAGLIWTDQTAGYVATADPLANSSQWLQDIRELHLTLLGRDRARGRVVLSRLPDLDEDDGRIITGMVMEEIARVIGDTYTASQLPRHLYESGVPAEYLPERVEGDNWKYVFDVFERLHNGGSAARRSLREFIGGWLEGRHHTPPTPDLSRRVRGTSRAAGLACARRTTGCW